MKRNITLIFLLSILGFGFLLQIHATPFPQTREEPLKYEIEVVVVDIPVYVIDKEGNPVLDLKPEDFAIYENGKEQKITYFTLVQNDSPEIVSLARRYPAVRRQFFLLFDLSFASPKGILRARETGLNFVKEKILPTDLVAVATYSILSGVQILVNFTNDRDQLLSAIDTLGLVKVTQRVKDPAGFSFGPVIAQEPSDVSGDKATGGARDVFQEELRALEEKIKKIRESNYAGYVADFIEDLQILGQSLNIVEGRKHIIYFSEGFDSKILTGKSLKEFEKDTQSFVQGRYWEIDPNRFGDSSIRMNLYNALKDVVSSDCLIHTVDLGGLRTVSADLNTLSGTSKDQALIQRGQITLNLLSSETGGKAYRNVNNLDQPLEDILKLTNSYYLLGYSPTDKKKEGKFRKLKVKVKRPNLQVSYRKGYYEDKPYKDYSSLEKQLQLAEYVVKDIPSQEIKVDSFVSAFRGNKGITQVPVFLKFPGNQFLEKNRKSKEINLEIYGYAISSSGQFRDFFHQTLKINLKKAKRKLETTGIKYYDLLLVPPGDYKIKC
ncbi:MAG: VWA domain-containing protein, partial [Candidatus Aminicenantia bacterium]